MAGRRIGRAIWLACGLALVTAMLGGCVAVDNTARPSAPPVPKGLTPSRLLVNASTPQDRDGDAIPDVVSMIVYFFAFDPDPVGVDASGTLRFVLTSGERVLGMWQIPESQYAPARSVLAAGVGYPLELRMPRLEPGELPDTATLTGEFVPSGEGASLMAASVDFRFRR